MRLHAQLNVSLVLGILPHILTRLHKDSMVYAMHGIKVWESIRNINLAAGNVRFISYITDGYYSSDIIVLGPSMYKASLQSCGCIGLQTDSHVGLLQNRHRPCKLKTYNKLYFCKLYLSHTL